MHTAIQDPSAAMDWQQAPVGDLIGFVMNRFHAAHREQLPGLTRLARRVTLVHAGKRGCLTALAELVEELHQEFESRMTKEERVLFSLDSNVAKGAHHA